MMRKLFLLALLTLQIWADAHVFVYHRFGDDKHASTNTSLSDLRAQFDYFKNNGYNVIPLSRLAQAFKNNEPIDEKWVVLTIDDSYKSFHENGLPIFKEYGYPFALFIYIEATERGYNDFMSWEQISEAAKYGEIALHSYAHEHMVSLDTQSIIADTQKGYSAFEERLGFKPRYYAYPYGEFNQKVRSAIESFGFDLIFNQNSGAVSNESDPHDLDRIALVGKVNLKPKLRIATLPTTWIAPKSWPAGGKLKTIHATIPASITRLEYYLSGYGWKYVNSKNGVVHIDMDNALKYDRNRIFLKHGNRQSSMILVKE